MIRSILATFYLLALSGSSFAQARMIKVDEVSKAVTIRNFSTIDDVSLVGYFMCRAPGTYLSVTSLTMVGAGDFDLSPGEEVTVVYPNILTPGTGVGLYVNSSFTNPASMADYMQFKGVAGFREGIAVSAGIWTSATFATGDPGPYFYVGNGTTDIGAGFWTDVPLTSASGSTANGSGGNPLCLSSAPALLGGMWSSSIDSSVRAVPTLAILVVRAAASSGVFLSGGELLVDLSSPRFAVLSAPAAGGPVPFALAVPYDPSLAGLTASAQGVVLGGGYTLCNGFNFTVGI